MVKFTLLRAPSNSSPDWEHCGAGSQFHALKQFTAVNGIPGFYIRLSLPIERGLFTGPAMGPLAVVLRKGWENRGPLARARPGPWGGREVVSLEGSPDPKEAAEGEFFSGC